MAKVKIEYHGLVHGNNKTEATPHDDGQHPIRGGGLEEWKIQNAKIINNGMIMAEDDRQVPYDCSDQSRASPTERGSPAGLETHFVGKTPRSIPSMFTAINNTTAGGRHDLPTSGPPSRVDGIPGPDYTRTGSLPQAGHISPLPPHQSLSGSHDPDMVPEARFLDILSESESMRIAEALEGLGGGDIQGFSYGDIPETMVFGHTLPGLPFGTLSKWQMAEETETG